MPDAPFALPLRVEPGDVIGEWLVRDRRNGIVAVCSSEADAAYIVRAVNERAVLVRYAEAARALDVERAKDIYGSAWEAAAMEYDLAKEAWAALAEVDGE